MVVGACHSQYEFHSFPVRLLRIPTPQCLEVLQLCSEHLGRVENAAPNPQATSVRYGRRQLRTRSDVHPRQQHLFLVEIVQKAQGPE